MRAQVVVPGAECRQGGGEIGRCGEQGLPEGWFQGGEEALDSAILPGVSGVGALVGYAQPFESTLELPCGEDRSVVGANGTWFAIAGNGQTEMTKNGPG